MASPPQEGVNALFPFSCSADQAIGNYTEPEVYEQARVELEWPVARQWQGRRKEEVRHVAEDDGAESLNQIYEHQGLDTGVIVCGVRRNGSSLNSKFSERSHIFAGKCLKHCAVYL